MNNTPNTVSLSFVAAGTAATIAGLFFPPAFLAIIPAAIGTIATTTNNN